MNGNANYDGADLIDAAAGDMVVVNFNYRVGPYGFLASKEDQANKTLSLNNGLKDQRLLLNWVQKLVEKVAGQNLMIKTLFQMMFFRRIKTLFRLSFFGA